MLFIKTLLYLLIALFALLVSFVFSPTVRDFIGGGLIALSAISFSILGVCLVILTIRNKVKGKLRKLLLIAGISAFAFFVCVLLHNLLYALLVSLGLQIEDEVLFFVLAILVFPLLFLVGAIGSLILLWRI
jgi:hypothetical protein